ncbi:FAD-binding oxidoreductase [Tropicimonas sp. IMCC34043]|uniref:NAD(P)/FAD-dependent oxidoreductase n=1 Tax=Tropicimonas sp. IMCC34043 TaxID=2248760 RepID=UPI000E25D400|nr:FAD-binding oxidoreductase [Tropicimonas sp. IMCC34043]
MQRICGARAYGPDPIKNSFWRASVSEQPNWMRPEGAITCDIAVVGGGYTGLTAALDLAEAGADVVLLEAEAPGWGASGRNGGFCCLGGAKLSRKQFVRHHGETAMREFFAAERDAVSLVAETLDRLAIDADCHSEGETQLAHSAAEMAGLRASVPVLRDLLGIEPRLTEPGDLAAEGLASPEFHGALTLPVGFALNPLSYALGLASAAAAAGARIFASAPVQAIAPHGAGWRLRLNGAEVTARVLVMATNAYGAEDVPAWMAGRFMPVQSNILVTRPLEPDELAEQGWTSRQMCYDTRTLLHYFRLMPDNRMLFGQRGAIRTDAAAEAAIFADGRRDFARMFPSWQAVEMDYAWSGMVAIARNRTPYVGPIPGGPTAFAGLAYHGNGVAMGSYAGGLLADLVLGRPTRRPYPTVMRAPMGRFPLGRFRRAMLAPIYTMYQLGDVDWSKRPWSARSGVA